MPVEFIDTAGCGYNETESNDTESKSNPEEVGLLQRHFESTFSGNTKNISFGIISPYRAQVVLLQNELEPIRKSSGDFVVNTIDSFQGQERDVIYISMVRSNDKSEIGFLKDYRRMNVAMTRARKKLIIIGDSATLGNDRFYQKLFEYCERIGAYRSAWEFVVA